MSEVENNLETEQIKRLASELEQVYQEVNKRILNGEFNINEGADKALWEKMKDKAVELHQTAKPTPVHHKYMINNRGVQPDNPEFYNHIHPVEDLLKFIRDPTANVDPEDQTIGKEFELKVFSRRWGHDDTYRLKRVEAGWHVGYISISGTCDKSGVPYLYENLNHDSINYPEELPGYLEWLWNKAEEKGLSEHQVQESLDILGRWISLCEKNSPEGIWNGYK